MDHVKHSTAGAGDYSSKEDAFQAGILLEQSRQKQLLHQEYERGHNAGMDFGLQRASFQLQQIKRVEAGITASFSAAEINSVVKLMADRNINLTDAAEIVRAARESTSNYANAHTCGQTPGVAADAISATTDFEEDVIARRLAGVPVAAKHFITPAASEKNPVVPAITSAIMARFRDVPLAATQHDETEDQLARRIAGIEKKRGNATPDTAKAA